MGTKTIGSTSVFNNRITFSDIEDEIIHFLRNHVTDRRNRALSGTETFIGDGSTTIFELTGDSDSEGRHKLMNITSLTVDGILQTFLTDYTAGFRNESPILGKVQFWNAPVNSSAIAISYKYKYSFIFSEEPRIDLTTKSYPRISIQLFNVNPKDVAIGGKVTKFDILFRFNVIDETRNYVQNIIQEIKDLFVTENVKHGFHTFDYIHEPRLTPLIKNGEDPNDVVYVQEIELTIPNIYEFSE